MEFDGLEYTREALAEEFALMERHARDGSAVKGGCSCIEEMHLITIAGLSSEGVKLATDVDEKNYYFNLANEARERRLEILHGDFKKAGNPHSLSTCEKKQKSCIEKVELKCCGEHTTDYSGCTCNPVAVCRASVPCK